MRHTGNRIGGSNPSLSANVTLKQHPRIYWLGARTKALAETTRWLPDGSSTAALPSQCRCQAPDRSVLDLDLVAERPLEQIDLMLFHAQAVRQAFDMLDVEVQRPEQRRDVAAHHRTEFPLGALHEEMKEAGLLGLHRNRVAVHQATRKA